MRDTHPLIAFSYFVAVISLTMCATHPVMAALSLTVALLYLLVLKGPVAALPMLGMALGVSVVVTVFNMAFVHRGMTVVFYMLGNPVTLEATLYGLSLGLMLSAVLMWFMCYQEVVGTDRFLALFSWAAPTTVMMVSMIFNYIPQVMQKSRQIDDAYKALMHVDKPGDQPPDKPTRRAPLKQRLRWPVRLSSILMGWSMETGLSTAASMRARAYGTTRRSSYLPLTWSLRDGVLIAMTAVLAAAAIVATVMVMSGFLFYPRMPALAFDWLYLPFVAFAAWPLAYELGIRLKWRLSRY
jgi:energy-coupling factor transport system permease protein